jgi:hypothetical protein
MKTFKAKGNTTRRVAGVLNKTEQAYASLLQQRKLAGEIHHYGFEEINLKLAKLTSYLPDFFIINSDGTIEFHEVKGFWTSSARVKIKVSAARHPWFIFKSVKYKNKKWIYEEF